MSEECGADAGLFGPTGEVTSGELPCEEIKQWPSYGRCHLCEVVGPLCRSHIIPKFFGDWLRATNATGRLRNSKAPNRLVEDLPWRYMLCAACGQRLNRYETYVCERIFLPLRQRRQELCRYGPEFLSFGVSVLWRALLLLRVEGNLGRLEDLRQQVSAAETLWRRFLIGDAVSTAPHDVHALSMDAPPPDVRLRTCLQISEGTCFAELASYRFSGRILGT